LRAKEVIRILLKAGYIIVRSSGSHIQLRHFKNPKWRPTVPMHTKDLSRQVLSSIIKQAGLSVKEFLKLMGK
ncbi:MAG: type II toxin-antitoxin system HicA family toxin, partial [Patescibacteria group bacterium]